MSFSQVAARLGLSVRPLSSTAPPFPALSGTKPPSLTHVTQRRQVETTAKLLEEDNTVPFITRYRRDATGCARVC